MENLIVIKAGVLGAKNDSQSTSHKQLLSQIYKDLECLEELASGVPEICKAQKFEPTGENSIRGMLQEFHCLRRFDEQVCRMFSRNLCRAIKSYRKQIQYVPEFSL